MNSKTKEVMVLDCNSTANEIMRDIIDVNRIEKMLSCDLSSEDLFRIDSAIITNLRNTTDFSRDLLHQLEAGIFEKTKPQRTLDDELKNIQQNVIMDINIPLQKMFDEMSNLVAEAYRS